MRRRLLTISIMIFAITMTGCGKSATNIEESAVKEEAPILETEDESQTATEIKCLELVTDIDKYQDQDDNTKAITHEDFLISKEFGKKVESISIDKSNGIEKQIEESYDEIQKIIDENDLDVKYVKKADNGVIIKFNSGIKYYHYVFSEDVKEGTGSLHVSTLQPFYSSGLSESQTDSIATNIESTVENAVFELNLDDSQVNYDMLYEIFVPNSVVVWDGHGGWDEENNKYYLLLGENSADAIDGNAFLESAAAKEWILLSDDNRMAISADLIWGMNIDTTNSMIFLNTCLSMKDGEFASALVYKGADLVCGYTDTVSVKYAEAFVHKLFKEMCVTGEEGYIDYGTACLAAISECGDCDPYHEEKAQPCYIGNKEYSFDKAIAKIIEEPEQEYLDPLDDGAYTTYDMPTVEEPTLQEMPVFTQAKIEDGELIINASFEQWDENWTTCTSYPYGARKMKVSDDLVIQHSGGIEAPEKDTAEGFNDWYADLEAPNRMDHSGLSLYIVIENGEVVLIDIGS